LCKFIKNTLDKFIELVFPENNTCCICGYWDEEIGKKYICRECLLKLKSLQGHKCKICSKPLISSGDICMECIETPKFFKKVYSPYKYEGLLRDVIKDFKYNNKPYYYKMLGELLYQHIKDEKIDFDIITYVPLHKNKKRRRGYNQSQLIAKYIGNRMNVSSEKLIKRLVDTKPQNQLNREDRKNNLKNTFSSEKKIKNKNILLVDDVYTTGTTLNACSEALLKVGAKNIYALTLAR